MRGPYKKFHPQPKPYLHVFLSKAQSVSSDSIFNFKWLFIDILSGNVYDVKRYLYTFFCEVESTNANILCLKFLHFRRLELLLRVRKSDNLKNKGYLARGTMCAGQTCN